MSSGENETAEGTGKPAPGGPPAYGQPPPSSSYGQPPPPAYGQPPTYSQQPPGDFGQYQYGQPMYGGGVPPAPYAPPRARYRLGVVGLVIATVGGVAGVLAFTAVDWFKGPRQSHFSDVHDWVKIARIYHVDTAVSYLYFSWLGWVLLAAAVTLALLACLPSPASGGLRVLGALVSLAGIGLTFWSVEYAHGEAYTEFIKIARVGFYLTLGAFLLTFIASLIGPRRTS